MSKSSFTFEEFQQGTKGQLSEPQQIAFDKAYFQDTAQAQAIHAALQFNKQAGDENALLTETRKAEWINKLASLFFVIALAGVWLLQTSSPYSGRDLATIQTEHSTSIENLQNTSNIENRSVDSPVPENNLNYEETPPLNNPAIENRNKTIFNTKKQDTSEIVFSQKTNSEQLLSYHAEQNWNNIILIENTQGGICDRLNNINMPDSPSVDISTKNTGISSSRSVTEPYAPDPYLIRLLLSSIR